MKTQKSRNKLTAGEDGEHKEGGRDGEESQQMYIGACFLLTEIREGERRRRERERRREKEEEKRNACPGF